SPTGKDAPEVAALVVKDSGGRQELNSKGEVVAALTENGRAILTTRDGAGNVTGVQIKAGDRVLREYKREGDKWKLNGTDLPVGTKVEFNAAGDLIQYKNDKSRPEFVQKLDGTRIERVEGSDEVAGGHRYQVENARGEISEYHFSAAGGNQPERIFEGGRIQPDGTVAFSTKLMRMKDSAKDGKSTYAVMESEDTRAGRIPAGKTWVGTQTLDFTTGARLSEGAIPGQAATSQVRTADGWNYDPKDLSKGQTRTEPGPSGAILHRDGSGNLDSVIDGQRNRHSITRGADGQISKIETRLFGDAKRTDTLESKDGRNWTRTWVDEQGKTRTESFRGIVTVGPDGTIRENREDGTSRTRFNSGASIETNPETGEIKVGRARDITIDGVSFGKEFTIAGMTPDGRPTKTVDGKGNYMATADGTTWQRYDAQGKPVGEPFKQTVEFNPITGDLSIKKGDGSRQEDLRADGTYTVRENVGPGGEMVKTRELNEHGERLSHKYEGGVKQETLLNAPDGTHRKYKSFRSEGHGNMMLLTEFSDRANRTTKLEWDTSKENPRISSYTDEWGDTWKAAGDGSFNRTTNIGPAGPRRHTAAVFINREGRLEMLSKTASNLTSVDQKQTEVNIRVTRGTDGNTFTTFREHGGLTVRGHDNLLARTVGDNGQVHQFGYHPTDRNEFGQPVLREVTEGDAPDSKKWSMVYLKFGAEQDAQKWKDMRWTSSTGEERTAFWRVDQVTGDMTWFNDDLTKQRYSLDTGWGKQYSGDLQQKANDINTVFTNWAIRHYFWYGQPSRYQDLKGKLEGLSGDDIQMMQWHLLTKHESNRDLRASINDVWSGWQREVLTRHVDRNAYTTDTDEAQRADARINAALAEMRTNQTLTERRDSEAVLRESLGHLNQYQLELLKQTTGAQTNNPETLLRNIQDHPAWKKAPEIHRKALELYLQKGKDQRTPQEEADLMRLALQYTSTIPGSTRPPSEFQKYSYSSLKQRLAYFEEFAGADRASDAARADFRDNGGARLLEEAFVRPGARTGNPDDPNS
ncbi:MAG: hypothetical protein K2Z81_27630, partial [Cyanobacteria bacterium]|nr:hypothetical protein [Cyanobacteriota bacterium]